MLPTTTPFPVDMPYWDPSWIPLPYPLPLPIPTVTITTTTTIALPFLNPELLLNLPSNSMYYPTNTGFSPSSLMPTAPAPPSPAINAHARDGSIHYYSPNYVPAHIPSNTPTYTQPMLSPVPAPPVALPPCAPPAPSTPVAATPPRKCGNCGTTHSCQWINVKSKDNIRCKKCYDYRRINKTERPVAARKLKREIKMKRI